MKKFLTLTLLLSSCIVAAQTTSVTGTIMYPDGQTFTNGTVSAAFTPSSGNISVFTYKLNGVAFPYNVNGTMNGSGTFTLTLTDDHKVTPLGGQWTFTVCSNANLPCASSLQDVFGPAIDLSGPINASIISAIGNSFNYPKFYNDTEAALNLGPGIAYYNLNTNKIRFFNGTIWQDISTGGGGGGNINPGTNNSQFPTWNTGSSLWVPQNKAIYDTRDWMTCDGNGVTGTDASAGMNLLLSTIGTNEATIRFVGSTTPGAACRIGNTFFNQNITLDFSGGGAIQLISSNTAIGGGTFVSGTSVECGSGITCSLPAFSVTTGNTLVVGEAPYPGFTFKTTKVTDSCGNFYIHVFQSLFGQPRNQGAWVASNVTGGSCTITATANGSLTTHMMIVAQVSGMGPVTSLDNSASNNNTGTTMSSGSATTLTGAFLFAFGGQPFTFPETCTAGAGYTQPASTAGQSSPNGSICMEYANASGGGSTSATQTISTNPSPGTWVYSLVSLKPGNATATIWGGIYDPDQHQIFYNADSATGHGVVDFTGSGITFDVVPEWWGASTNASASTNTPAIQASIWAAFGGGKTQARTNASGLSQYNRPLHIGSIYQINDELKMFNTNGFAIHGINRLASGFNQTVTNKRIINGQSNTYGVIDNIGFSTQASQNVALVDIDWDGVTTPGDLKPQFLDFNHVNFAGSGVGFIGLEIAKSGGAAQGSNIYCRDCAFQSFTEACAQIGTHANLAGNALAIGFSGDMQGCNKNGIAVYGGGYVSFGDGVEESSMENGYSTQTGFDMYCELTQGPCSMDYMRSESRRLISGNDIVLHKTRVINQAAFLPPGQTFPVGSIMIGSIVAGDGAFYTVTSNAGAANGIGTPTALLTASSGSSTTLVDTNQTVAGAVTILKFGITPNEVVTQAVTGSTGTVLTAPSSSATISGTLTSGSFVFGDIAQQAVTGVTCTIGSGNTSVLFNCSNFSGTADGTHVWTDNTTLATFTPSGVPAFSASSMLITAATGSPDSTHDWVGGTNGGHFTPSGLPINQANFTVNGFAGMSLSVLSGKNAGCYNTIASNTATSITLNASWITRYDKLGCPGPDTSSNFLVEPTWNHGTVTSGGMTMVYLNENAIDCEVTFNIKSGCVPQLRLEDVIEAGGQIRAALTGSVIDGLLVSRQDWFDNTAGQNPQTCCDQPFDWDIRVSQTIGPNVVPYQGIFYQSWTLPSLGGTQYNGALQRRLGTKALVWDIGNIGTNNPPANASASSVSIGGRSDNGASNDATRNILEYTGMFGRGAPKPSASNNFNTTDQSGTDSDITGGPSTGAGIGGAINWWISTPSVSSQVVNSGAKVGRVNNTGQIESLLSTGTAPFKAASTTPVTNLTTVPVTYNVSGTQLVNVHIIADSSSLTSGTPSTKVITLSGAAVFTSNTSYKCAVSNTTNPANSLAITYTDGSHFTVTGPNTVSDGFSFNCVGN